MWSSVFAQQRHYPSRILLAKAAGRAQRTVKREVQRICDYFLLSSHGQAGESLDLLPLAIDAGDIPESLCHYLAEVAPFYLEHRFNLLGSGWVNVAHGVACAGQGDYRFPPCSQVRADRWGKWLKGRVNRRNLEEAQQIWHMIGREDYVPIDWQLDFKSGYRWSEKTYHCDIRIGPAPGADIKVPRELARMQHLPQLALCALRAANGDTRFAPTSDYLREIRAQILDFIATNPPRFGVNWACAMDVAIRVANWLMTLDLLATNKLSLGPDVLPVVARSVADHAKYVSDHLEWSENYRTNHYLADVVGLLYAASHLDSSPRNDAWLAFAVREVMNEALVQFYPEGSCYEGSTSYHRLSAELLLFGVALAAGLPLLRRQALQVYSTSTIRVRPPFPGPPVPFYSDKSGHCVPVPPEVTERLWRAAQFTKAVSRPDGRIVQIGDTDSGRLFCLHPMLVSGSDTPAVDDLNHASLVESIEYLFSQKKQPLWFDTRVVQALSGVWCPAVPVSALVIGDQGDADAIERMLMALPEKQRRLRRFPLLENGETWQREAFPCFGLYIFRREQDFVVFRCAGPVITGTPNGHRHDDNLGLELMLQGRLVIADSGTFVYTADPEMRNRYREAAAHDVPRARSWAVAPPGRLLFTLEQRAFAECICWRPDAVCGRIESPYGSIYRLIRLRVDTVEILDAVLGDELAQPGIAPPLCEGYGRKA